MTPIGARTQARLPREQPALISPASVPSPSRQTERDPADGKRPSTALRQRGAAPGCRGTSGFRPGIRTPLEARLLRDGSPAGRRPNDRMPTSAHLFCFKCPRTPATRGHYAHNEHGGEADGGAATLGAGGSRGRAPFHPDRRRYRHHPPPVVSPARCPSRAFCNRSAARGQARACRKNRHPMGDATLLATMRRAVAQSSRPHTPAEASMVQTGDPHRPLFTISCTGGDGAAASSCLERDHGVLPQSTCSSASPPPGHANRPRSRRSASTTCARSRCRVGVQRFRHVEARRRRVALRDRRLRSTASSAASSAPDYYTPRSAGTPTLAALRQRDRAAAPRRLLRRSSPIASPDFARVLGAISALSSSSETEPGRDPALQALAPERAARARRHLLVRRGLILGAAVPTRRRVAASAGRRLHVADRLDALRVAGDRP